MTPPNSLALARQDRRSPAPGTWGAGWPLNVSQWRFRYESDWSSKMPDTEPYKAMVYKTPNGWSS